MLVNALEAGHYWAAKLGWDRWLAAGYQAHRGRILGHFWRHGSFAEAVQEFEEDPELAAGAAVAEEEQRQDFEHLYGHLRAEHP